MSRSAVLFVERCLITMSLTSNSSTKGIFLSVIVAPFTKRIPLLLGWKQGFAMPRLPKLVFFNVLIPN